MQMLISVGVLCSTAGVSCDAAAESCAFYARKPTASPIQSRWDEEIWKSGPVLPSPSSSYVRMRPVSAWDGENHVRVECRSWSRAVLAKGGLTSQLKLLSPRNLLDPRCDGGAHWVVGNLSKEWHTYALLGLGLAWIRCMLINTAIFLSLVSCPAHVYCMYWDTRTAILDFFNWKACHAVNLSDDIWLLIIGTARSISRTEHFWCALIESKGWARAE